MSIRPHPLTHSTHFLLLTRAAQTLNKAARQMYIFSRPTLMSLFPARFNLGFADQVGCTHVPTHSAEEGNG
jgi:hypothetical protein